MTSIIEAILRIGLKNRLAIRNLIKKKIGVLFK